ncbi:hypothetical protein [Microtetraspora sp. NBRC 16547]|uniref:hypothetical protein n=1 Tax=Microtetraspora sp. NBRC 16547 TaxID=3030993 RepID=UPI0024A3BCCE|nr:hypothetical protein [Microtetraspora sp. NBRC 16547]GLW99211.1 hypothetical protein Misp02_32980 [Microtetraspora sp. NBRC 16547]
MLTSPGGVQMEQAEPVTEGVTKGGGARHRLRRALSSGHSLFVVVITLAAALRAVVMLGYNTAQLYWYDSFTYLDTAVHLKPGGAFHPAGYSFFLRLLWPFHSVSLVVGVQHVMGLGMGLMIYLLLRRRSLPAWGATLATLPVLFDPSFVRLEHSVLSDTQVTFLVIAALTVLMWRAKPSVRSAAVAGVLLAVAGLTRTAAAPLLVLFVLYLVLQRVGWRQVVALAVAGTLPLAAYAGWYQQHHGRFALSGSDGVALWARTMTFADCSKIKPPAEEARLCPNGTVVDAAGEYVWAADTSLNRLPGDRFSHNDLARSFALRAIAAQPLDYLREVVSDASLAFAWTPVSHPKRVVPALMFPVGSWPLPSFPLIHQVRVAYDPAIRGMASVEPYDRFFAAYRYPNALHGPLFGLVLLLGGLGAIGRRRPALLPWAAAMFLFVGPIAALDFDHRYMLPAVPVACVAAALGAASLWRARPGRRATAQ